MRNAVQTTYFCFSFGFLLVRTAAVSLYAAGIHDESVLPAPVLYSVSSSNYSTEVGTKIDLLESGPYYVKL